MKLYEVPRGTPVRVVDQVAQIPQGSPKVAAREIIDFHHIDGMYSYCTNQKGETVHLAAWTEVEIVK